MTALEGQGGFLSWRWNHRTRSLLLLYDAQATSSEAVLEIVTNRLGGLDIAQARPATASAAKPSALAVAVSQGLAELDARVTSATRGLVDLRILFPLGLFAWAVRELGRGAVAPLAWSSALWYAHGLFRDYNFAPPRPTATTKPALEWRIAHSVRGRLRLRGAEGRAYPRAISPTAQLKGVVGVRSVRFRSRTGSLVVEYDPESCTEAMLLEALGGSPAAGGITPPVEPAVTDGSPFGGDRAWVRYGSLLNLATAGAAFTASLLPVPAGVTAGLVVLSGFPILARLGQALRDRPPPERRHPGRRDVPCAARARETTPRPACSTGLHAAGQWILERTVVRSRRSLRDLFAPPDQMVRRRRGQRQERISATAIVPGDTVVLGAGDRVPIDGHVIRGEALVDQHTMTGEGLPVERKTRHEVYAGTTVEDGEIAVSVDRVGRDTGLGHIIEAIERAAGEKPEVQVFAERLANRLVGQTIFFGLVGAAVSRSIDAGIAIVVADYGTATRVAIPVVALAKVHQAVMEGILLKGPGVLEHLARIDTVVFDKTGTLTWGRPQVSRIASYGSRRRRDPGSGRSGGARRPSPVRAHDRPPARSERAWSIPKESGPETRIGLGVAVTVDGDTVLVGNRRFLESQGIDLAPAAADEAEAHARGASVTFVAVGTRLVGAIVLEDELRADAAAAIHALRARDTREIVMVSGDHPEPTRFVARELGVERYHADLLPEDKAALIRELRVPRGGRWPWWATASTTPSRCAQPTSASPCRAGPRSSRRRPAWCFCGAGSSRWCGRSTSAAPRSSAYRRTIDLAVYGNLVVGGLASLGFAGPATAILISNGTALGAPLLALRLCRSRRQLVTLPSSFCYIAALSFVGRWMEAVAMPEEAQ